MSKLPSDQVEWAELGERLRIANPTRFAEVLGLVRDLTEGYEVIAKHDHQLLLRARRPTKRYAA